MNIKYYGIEGVEIDPRFKNPEYWIDQIIKHDGGYMGEKEYPDMIEQLDAVHGVAHEKGVVYYITNDVYYPKNPYMYDDAPTELKPHTTAKLIVSDSDVSFIIIGTDHDYADMSLDQDSLIMTLDGENKFEYEFEFQQRSHDDENIAQRKQENLMLSDELEKQLGKEFVTKTPETHNMVLTMNKEYKESNWSFETSNKNYQKLHKEYRTLKDELLRECKEQEKKYIDKLVAGKKQGFTIEKVNEDKEIKKVVKVENKDEEQQWFEELEKQGIHR